VAVALVDAFNKLTRETSNNLLAIVYVLSAFGASRSLPRSGRRSPRRSDSRRPPQPAGTIQNAPSRSMTICDRKIARRPIEHGRC
jgi:hypothetical protein